MKSFERSERVSGLIKKILSDLLRKVIKDPRLKTITITGVKTSADLRIARIYYITSDNKNCKEAAAEGFKNALGYIKRILAGELGLRYMPELRFYYDESFDYGSHIDALLQSLRTENGSNHTAPEKK